MSTATKYTVTLTVTLPTGKKGQLQYFKILFDSLKFDEITNAITLIKTPKELKQSNLWKVL